MPTLSIRLAHIWNMIPGNHHVVLRVRRPETGLCYTARTYDKAEDGCPYDRQFAKVISMYAISTEIIEIIIEENMFVKD